jgi:peptide deformylase
LEVIEMTILTLDKDPHGCLAVTCVPIQTTPEALAKARQVITWLKETVKPLLPAAGLASTQIGLKDQIFVFSWDRSEEQLCGAINPAFEPLDETKEHGWEACFSTILGDGPYTIAYVPRYKKIAARYVNENGQEVRQILENFAARVFQHEYDHLQGLVNVQRPDAETKVFQTREELLAFTSDVKKKDQVHYTPPVSFQ